MSRMTGLSAAVGRAEKFLKCQDASCHRTLCSTLKFQGCLILLLQTPGSAAESPGNQTTISSGTCYFEGGGRKQVSSLQTAMQRRRGKNEAALRNGKNGDADID